MNITSTTHLFINNMATEDIFQHNRQELFPIVETNNIVVIVCPPLPVHK